MEKIYYSIRIVKAESRDEAIDKIIDGKFDETVAICDAVLTEEELLKAIEANK